VGLGQCLYHLNNVCFSAETALQKSARKIRVRYIWDKVPVRTQLEYRQGVETAYKADLTRKLNVMKAKYNT
jgi:hypothetical protein